MTRSVKDMLAEANAEVGRISREEAEAKVAAGALLLDVRDANEVAATGLAAGAVNVSRGMLEFRADPDSPHHDPRFSRDRPVILYCASGGRSALAGATLKRLGYAEVWNLGGLKDWAEAGGAVEGAPGASGGGSSGG